MNDVASTLEPDTAELSESDIATLTRAALAKLAEYVEGQPGSTPAEQRDHLVRWVNTTLSKMGLASGSARSPITEQVMRVCFRSTKLLDLWAAYPEATNLSVLGTEPVRIEHGDGSIEMIAPVVESGDELRRNILAIADNEGSRRGDIWDPARPEFEIIMGDGTRVTAIDWISQQPFVTLRRPTFSAVTLDDLVANNTLTQECAKFLTSAVRARLRILVAGSMNSGKTVLLRALASALPKTDAVMVAESQPELRLEYSDVYPDFVVSLAARRARSNDRYDISVRSLVERVQRMTPTVVIVGEVRGEESVALAAALGQGYAVMSTIHADSARGAVTNAAMYYEEATGASTKAALARLSRGVDLAIFMGRRPSNNARVVSEIAAVEGVVDDELVMSMLYCQTGDDLERTTAEIPNSWGQRLASVGGESH